MTGEERIETEPFEDLLRRAQKERGFPWENIAALRKTALAGGYVPDLDDLAPGAARRFSRLHILPELATRVRFLIRYAKLPTGVQK